MVDLALIGAGRIGRITARALVDRGFNILILDREESILKELSAYGLKVSKVDIRELSLLNEYLRGVDIVAVALPGSIAYNCIKALLKMGKSIVDVSFYPEDFKGLEEYAIKNKVFYIPDAGIAPGLSNILVGRSLRKLGSADNVGIFVGGISYSPDNLLGLALTWSPEDLLSQYVNKARIIKNHRIMYVDPLETTGVISIPKLGTYEYFVSDGLRTLLRLRKFVKEMAEYTLRYPGHIQKMKFLRDLHLLSNEVVKVNGSSIRAIKLLASLLSRIITNTYMDRLILYVKAVREENKVEYLLHKTYDRKNKMSALASATAYVFATIIEMAYNRYMRNYGITTLEEIGFNDELFKIFTRIVSAYRIKVREIKSP